MQNGSHAQSCLAFRKWLQKQSFQSLFDFTYWPISCFHVNEKRKESSGSVLESAGKQSRRECVKGAARLGEGGQAAQSLTARKQITVQYRKGLSRSCPVPFHLL